MEQEICVSRVDPNVSLQEETSPNLEPPMMSTSFPLKASHTEIMDTIVATVEKATKTEEDTPLFRRKLQKLLGIPFIAAATKKDRNLRPLINFAKKRDWDVIKACYGQYWFSIRNRLHVRDDCLLDYERIVIPSQLRQTVLDSLDLTQPESAAMLDLSEHVWFQVSHDTPSLKSLIQEMGFSEKTPEYKTCVQFIQAISPKHRTSIINDVIDLTSPAEADDEKMENDDIFCFNILPRPMREYSSA